VWKKSVGLSGKPWIGYSFYLLYFILSVLEQPNDQESPKSLMEKVWLLWKSSVRFPVVTPYLSRSIYLCYFFVTLFSPPYMYNANIYQYIYIFALRYFRVFMPQLWTVSNKLYLWKLWCQPSKLCVLYLFFFLSNATYVLYYFFFLSNTSIIFYFKAPKRAESDLNISD
jgi:hypothetical protein